MPQSSLSQTINSRPPIFPSTRYGKSAMEELKDLLKKNPYAINSNKYSKLDAFDQKQQYIQRPPLRSVGIQPMQSGSSTAMDIDSRYTNQQLARYIFREQPR